MLERCFGRSWLIADRQQIAYSCCGPSRENMWISCVSTWRQTIQVLLRTERLGRGLTGCLWVAGQKLLMAAWLCICFGRMNRIGSRHQQRSQTRPRYCGVSFGIAQDKLLQSSNRICSVNQMTKQAEMEKMCNTRNQKHLRVFLQCSRLARLAPRLQMCQEMTSPSHARHTARGMQYRTRMRFTVSTMNASRFFSRKIVQAGTVRTMV